MKGISAKLEVLDDEFQITHNHNPIHHLECRIKGVSSLYHKIQRYGIPLTLDSIRDHIQDIAGIRVVCNFTDDIYAIEKMLLKQSDVALVKRKDYIARPKENGYRSLHLVVKVPVFLSDRTEDVPVEIQLRTIAMDYWASLEHKSERLRWMEHFRRFEEMAALDRRIVANLISYIRIKSKTEIQIQFNYQDEYETASRLLQKGAA